MRPALHTPLNDRKNPAMDTEFDRFDFDGDDPKAVPPSPDEFAEAWGNATFPPAVLTAARNAELMRSAPPAQMNAIEAMKNACVEALELNALAPGDASVYASMVDPVSVLALIEIAENRISDEEIAALHQVLDDLCNYVRANAPGTEADALLLRARQLIGLTQPY